MSFWLPRELLNCLGWSLLHFLWQGLVMAGLFAGALALLRRQSANARYLAGCFALLSMALAPLLTFNYLLKQESAESPRLTISTTVISYDNKTEPNSPRVAAEPAQSAVAEKPAVRKLNISERLEIVLPWCVAGWSLGVLMLSCRLLAGWLQIQRLKRTASAALVEPWQKTLRELARRVGVSRPLRLLQSAWVEVPTVMGWLRPVILLPASCLTGLTPGQLESILAHELAHIRRHDYLINLLQNVVETILFYHPAVWWVSRRIRQEREHCCDDLAVKICGDAAAYARALATLEELRPAPAQLQLAASGAPLLERIRRLLDPPRPAARRPGWALAVVITMMVTLLLTFGLRSNRATAANSAASVTVTNSLPASPPPATATNAVEENKLISKVTRALPGLNQATVAVTNHEEGSTPQAQNLPQSPPPPATGQTNQPSTKPHVAFVIKWAEMEVSDKTTNALTWLLADRGSVVNLPATFAFSEYLTVQPTNLAESEYEVILRTNSSTGPLAAILSDQQYRMDIQALEQRDGVDVLTCAEATTAIDRPLQVQVVDATSIVIGGSLPGNTNGPRVLTNQLTGPVVDIVPHFATDGRTLELNITGTINEFVGYEDPVTVTNRAGKSMPKSWGIPHFRMRQFTATVAVGDGRSVVLGAAAVPITNIKRTKHKIPLLGDLPYLGHLFRSSYVTTNTTQKSLMLFITPKLINPDGTPWVQPRRVRLSNLVEDAKLLYEAGKLDEAEAKLNRVLREDASNVTAVQYLRLVHEKQKIQQARLDPFNRTNLVYTSKGRQIIISLLDRIRVPSVAYTNLPLGQVINNLSVIAKRGDPENIGINFFISREAITVPTAGSPTALDPTTGLPVALLPTDTGTDARSVTVTINPALNDVRLADVLDAITKTANMPIKYSIFDYAVVFSLRGSEPVPLEIRTFHVNSYLFKQTLESYSSGPLNDTNAPAPVTNAGAGIRFISSQSNSLDRLQVSVRSFFSTIGVDFNTNNPATIGKAFAWGDKKGVLTVRATTQDLDRIAATIETLNLQAPRISFKVRFVQVDQQTNRAMGFNWTIGTNGLNGSNALNAAKNPLVDPAIFRTPQNTPTISSMAGVLTGAQYQAAIEGLEQSKRAHFLDDAEVTAINGRRTQIQATDAATNGVSNAAPALMPLGNFNPILEVVPYVDADGTSIQMTLMPSVAEFIGYDDPGEFATDKDGKSGVVPGKPIPHYRVRQTTTAVTVNDGQTVVLSNVIADMPLKDPDLPPDSTNSPGSSRKNLMIFITPTIVNPDGTPFHGEKKQALH